MGSERRFLIYQPKKWHFTNFLLTVECPLVVSCKEGTRGKVVSLNTVTQRSPTRRCEFMGEERRLQGAFRPKKGISATLVNYLVSVMQSI